MAKGKCTTEHDIRVTVTRSGKGQFGANADGTVNVAVKNIVSAFGPKNPGNIYCIKVPAGYEFPTAFDLRNDSSGLWLGTWEVIPGAVGNATLWDMTTVKSATPKPAAIVTAPSAAQPVRPSIVGANLSDFRALISAR